MRRKHKYIGSINIEGHTLRTREVVFKGEIWVVPEHITPVELKNKGGEVNYSRWQVRLSKPWKSFQELDDAISYLENKIKSNPPKHEYKFTSIESKRKLYKTGAPGIYFQSGSQKNKNCEDIRLQLTFKSHDIAFYIGTERTVTKESYERAFIRLFIIRRWLEELSKHKDLSWKNDQKKIDSSIEKSISESFKTKETRSAKSVITYDGLEDYIDSLIAVDTMKNITEHYSGMYEVRISRKGKSYNRFFNKADYLSSKRALLEAVEWRNQILSGIGGINVDRELGGTGRNESTGINGISRMLKNKGSENFYVVFDVHYRDKDRKPKCKSFSAGNVEKLSPEKEKHVFQVALLFRLSYEKSRKLNKPFILDKNPYREYKNWSPEEIERRFSKLGIKIDDLSKYLDVYSKNSLML